MNDHYQIKYFDQNERTEVLIFVEKGKKRKRTKEKRNETGEKNKKII